VGRLRDEDERPKPVNATLRPDARATQPHRRRARWIWATAVVALVAAALIIAAAVSSNRDAQPSGAPAMPTPSASGVAGYLFQDRDGDGLRGQGEPLLPDWEVRVHSTGPAALATTTTDGHGVFAFTSIDDVTPGETTVDIRVRPVIEGPAVAGLPDDTALTQTFTIPLGEQRAIPVAAYSPCVSLDDCTGLVLPDLVPQLSGGGADYPASTVTRVDTTTDPGRVLLRFATSTANLGGLLHVTAGEVSGDGETQTVQQRLYGQGRTFVHDAGQFVYHAEHHHFHLDEFQSYELLSEDRATVVASSEKISFCLTDVLAVDAVPRSDGDVFLQLPPFDCGVHEQGINTGYADYYGAELPDQWIDVTGLASGRYWVRLTVDPRGLLVEADTTNNVAEFPVDLRMP
jgi:hypothetical protein